MLRKKITQKIYYIELIKVFCVSVVSCICVFLSMEIFNKIISGVTEKRITLKILAIGLFFYLLIQLMMYGINIIYAYVIGRAKERVQIELKIQSLKRLLENLSFSSFVKIGKGKLESVFLNDLSEYGELFLRAFYGLINNYLRLTVFVGILFYYHYLLGILTVLCIVVLSVYTSRANLIIERYANEKAMKKERFIHIYHNLIDGWQDFKAFKKEGFLKKKMLAATLDYENSLELFERKNTFIYTISSLVKLFIFVSIIFLEAYLYISGLIEIGNVVISISIIGLLQDEVDAIISNNQMLFESKPYENRILCLFDEDKTEEEVVLRDWKCLALEKVSFYYDEKRLILDNFCLKIERGKRYAIIGKSGCGKSTILKLLLGILEPSSGCIKVDDLELPKGSEAIFRISSYLEQDIYLFHDTIENNIFFGNYKKQKRVENSRFYTVLKKYLPDLSYVLENNGQNLSGGQRQLIGIARAIVFDKKIFIFDESFSAMNNQLFKEIRLAMNDMEDITFIEITHRDIHREEYDFVIQIEETK